MIKKENILSKIKEIPAIPAIVMEIYEIVNSPDVDFKRLSEIVKYDPALVAYILKVVNSAYYGSIKPIDDIRQAVVRLGATKIFEIVTMYFLTPTLSKEVKGYDIPPGKLWEHSVTTAIGAERLADLLGVRKPDYLYTTGILHDIGKIVIGNYLNIDISKVIDYSISNCVPYNEAEREVIGIDHGEIGGMLLEAWELPESIIKVVKGHHDINRYNENNISLICVHISDSISRIVGFGMGVDGLFYRADCSLLKKYKITSKVIEKTASFMIDELEKIKVSLFSL
ncbi:MAG: HDOD domain-containing protein [Candidatus Marinimicrobia bacterium]|nr:HDOD domain-containing protein [Candidatus Neomarinimicrobiota bacterium]